MNLSEYIKRKGTKEAAELFGVSEAAAKSYRYGWRVPRPEVANRIVSKTGGEVTLAEIFASAPKTDAAA